MIGLHCCGDLTSSMLKIYAASDLVRGIIVVGCCYNHLSYPKHPKELGKKQFGFPLSKTIAECLELHHFSLSPLMVEVSISCYGRWIARDEKTKHINVKSLAYRGILEEVLGPELAPNETLVIRGQPLSSASYSCK